MADQVNNFVELVLGRGLATKVTEYQRQAGQQLFVLQEIVRYAASAQRRQVCKPGPIVRPYLYVQQLSYPRKHILILRRVGQTSFDLAPVAWIELQSEAEFPEPDSFFGS